MLFVRMDIDLGQGERRITGMLGQEERRMAGMLGQGERRMEGMLGQGEIMMAGMLGQWERKIAGMLHRRWSQKPGIRPIAGAQPRMGIWWWLFRVKS